MTVLNKLINNLNNWQFIEFLQGFSKCFHAMWFLVQKNKRKNNMKMMKLNFIR